MSKTFLSNHTIVGSVFNNWDHTNSLTRPGSVLKPTPSLLAFVTAQTPAIQILTLNTTIAVAPDNISFPQPVCDEVQMNEPLPKAIQTIFYCLIMLLSLCGNCLVIAIFVRKPSMRTPVHYLITNMAASDVLFPCFVLPVKLTEIHAGRWLVGGDVGSFLCKLLPFLSDVSTAISVESLVFVAVDRFASVLLPMRKPLFTARRIRFALCLSWLVAAIFHWPYFLVFNTFKIRNHLYCISDWSLLGKDAHKNFYLALLFLLFVAPVVFLTILYSAIAVELRSKTGCGNFGALGRRRRRRENKRVMKMMVAVVLVFVISYAPIHFVILCHFYAPTIIQCNKLFFVAVVRILSHCNCAVNPVIYFAFSKNYFFAAKSLFKLHQQRNIN